MTPPSTDKLLSDKNLSYKIILGIMLGMSLLVSVLVVVFAYSFHILEHDLMRERNQAEMARIKEQLQQNPDYPLPQTAKLSIYQASDKQELPAYLRNLPEGSNSEISHEGGDYYVSVSENLGKVLYIVHDISEFENSENTFTVIIIVSWVILIALIFALSYILSHNLLKPISDFADEIGDLQPEQRGSRFSGNYHGQEVEKIARSIDRYLNKMDEYVERQHSFAAMASHELRTPLTVIQTSSELIPSITDNEHVARQCQKINRSIANMNDMIMALLSITRDQPADRQEKSRVVLFDVVEEVLNNLRHQVELNRITVENWVRPEVVFECNSAMLAVVIANLLSTAIKHSPQGSIRITYMNHGLSILDDGEGLGTENIDQLFKKGVAGKNSGGFGLGLYITSLICDKQGWTLELQNANPGTLAKVTFL